MRLKPINLLVVDDEPAIRRVLRTSLGATRYAIQEAANGEAALGTFQSARSDLVLLDINMPGMGGIETCRRIRQISPEIGIVMISVRERAPSGTPRAPACCLPPDTPAGNNAANDSPRRRSQNRPGEPNRVEG